MPSQQAGDAVLLSHPGDSINTAPNCGNEGCDSKTASRNAVTMTAEEGV